MTKGNRPTDSDSSAGGGGGLYADTTTVAVAASAATLKQVAVEKTRTPLRELVYIRA